MSKDMQKHIRIVSIILIVLGVFYLLAAGFITILGLMATNNQAQTRDIALLPAVLTGGTILLPLVLLGGFHILTARAFRAGKSWSRITLWILAIINLGNVPVGTGIGLYAMWVLLNTRQDAFKTTD